MRLTVSSGGWRRPGRCLSHLVESPEGSGWPPASRLAPSDRLSPEWTGTMDSRQGGRRAEGKYVTKSLTEHLIFDMNINRGGGSQRLRGPRSDRPTKFAQTAPMNVSRGLWFYKYFLFKDLNNARDLEVNFSLESKCTKGDSIYTSQPAGVALTLALHFSVLQQRAPYIHNTASKGR